MLYTITIIKNRMGKDDLFKQFMEQLYKISDKIIMLDNCSTDGTTQFIEQYNDPQNKIVLIKDVDLDFSKEESSMRAMLWEAVRKRAKQGDYVLTIDSDEFFEERFIADKQQILKFMEQNDYTTMLFKFCDMWGLEEKDGVLGGEYRIDGNWSPFFPRLYKFFNEPWGKIIGGLHQSNIPQYALQAKKVFVSDYRVKHYSYHTVDIRKAKYDYYIERTEGVNLKHAQTIMRTAMVKKFHEPQKFPKILICSLIRNREWILKDFLHSLEMLNYPKKNIGFYFIVNNSVDDSKNILKQWSEDNKHNYASIKIDEENFENAGENKERNWTEDVINNMSFMRNQHLKELRDSNFDYLFSVDSDLLLHPEILTTTLLQDKYVTSPVFWAKWKGDKALPQCWICDGYHVTAEWLQLLENAKGRFICGGLGALTLISKQVAEIPTINYNRLYNLSRNILWGEDRFFCVKCVANNIVLYCHTFLPTRHVDNEQQLEEHLNYIKKEQWYETNKWLVDRRGNE